LKDVSLCFPSFIYERNNLRGHSQSHLDLLRDYALLTGDPDYCRCCAAAQLAALFINSEELNPVPFLRTFSSALLTLGEGEEESEEGPPAWN
jgi:hypothetical protein